MNHHFIAVLATAVAASATAADDQVSRVPVENFRALMVAAIDSPSGESHGVLIGSMPEAITQRMRAAGPILIDVSTIRRYKQAGCSRLNVRFTQEGVHLPGAKEPRKETLDLGLNYCRDGTPPKSLA
jgi:hypothetical protein